MKLRPVKFSARAEAQLDRLYFYIERKSSARIANAYVNSIQRYCVELGAAGHIGQKMGGRHSAYRKVGFDRSATIIFVLKEDEIVIAGVFYRGMNVSARL